jgi:hypothetical protein
MAEYKGRKVTLNKPRRIAKGETSYGKKKSVKTKKKTVKTKQAKTKGIARSTRHRFDWYFEIWPGSL